MRKKDLLTTHEKLALLRRHFERRGASPGHWRSYDEMKLAPNTLASKSRHAEAVVRLACGLEAAALDAQATLPPHALTATEADVVSDALSIVIEDGYWHERASTYIAQKFRTALALRDRLRGRSS